MKRITTILVLLLAVVTLSAQDISGTWNGKISVTDQMGQLLELRLVLHISATDDGYTSTMDSPDQDAFDIPVDTTFLKEKEFTFKKAEFDVVYVGNLVDDANINGTLTQYGQSLELNLKKETE